MGYCAEKPSDFQKETQSFTTKKRGTVSSELARAGKQEKNTVEKDKVLNLAVH